MSQWTPKYSDMERAAIERHGCDLHVRPFRVIVAMAAAGELRAAADLEPVAPFTIPEGTVRAIVRAGDRKRAGLLLRAEVAKLPGRDRARQFQDRLSAVIDLEIQRLERTVQKAPGKAADAEQIRRVLKAVRELQTLPDPDERRLPRTPGDRVPGTGEKPDHAASPNSIAGQLLRAIDGAPATRTGTGTPTPRINTTDANTTHEPEREPDHTPHTHTHDDDHAPSLSSGVQVPGLSADSVVIGVPAPRG